MSEEWDREMSAKRIARRIENELREALAIMDRFHQGVPKYDYEYGTPEEVSELERLLEQLEPVTSRLVELSRRMP